MSDPIPVDLAVEDILSEETLRKILHESGQPYYIGAVYGKTGVGYLKKKIVGFNKAARGKPFLVLADLDAAECAPRMMSDWLQQPKHPNLIFRVAVHEVETWLMADRLAFADFLGISKDTVPPSPDGLLAAKEKLIALARNSPRSTIRKAIVPATGMTARIGPDYNRTLSLFVQKEWNPSRAGKNSPSLARTLNAIEHFRPVYRA